MDQQDYNFCRGQMGPDEYVLWQGKPEKGNYFTIRDLTSLLFPLVIAVFFVVTIYNGVKTGGLGFALIPIIFLTFIFVPYIAGIIRTFYYRKHTAYVITNKRIYRRRGKHIDNLSAANMPGYETQMHSNNCGTIRFILPHDPRRTTRVNGHVVPNYFTLENLADVERVQQAIARMEQQG